MDTHSRVSKKNTSHGNKVLPQDTMHPYKDHVTNKEVHAKIQQAIRPQEDLQTTKEMQTVVAWTCLQLSSLAKNHLTRHSERGKKTRQTEEEMGRRHQGMDRPGVIQIPEGRGEQEKWIKLVVRSSVVPLWRSLPEGLQVQQAAAAAAGWTDDWAGNCIITSSLHSHKWMFYAISEMMVIPISTSEKNDR